MRGLVVISIIGSVIAQTCNDTRALYGSVCCGKSESTPFVSPGSIVVQGSFAQSSGRRLSENSYRYELADATKYEVTFRKASLCTGTTNDGSYGPPIVCQGELVVGQGLTTSYDLADANIPVQLRNLPVDETDATQYTHLMVEMDRVVRLAGKSTSCCTTTTMAPDDASRAFYHFRYAQRSDAAPIACLSPNATESPFFTDAVLDVCVDAKCTATGSTVNPIVKDPPLDIGGSIVGIEKLVDDQPTMKVIVQTASAVTQSTSLTLTWFLTNSIAFELFDGANCNVGPYYLTVVVQ